MVDLLLSFSELFNWFLRGGHLEKYSVSWWKKKRRKKYPKTSSNLEILAQKRARIRLSKRTKRQWAPKKQEKKT